MVTAALFAPETTHSPAWQSTAGGSVPPATRAATALLQTSLGPVRGCFVPSPGSLQGEDGPDDRDSEGHPPDTNDLDYNSRMVILATGTTGEIKVFENFGPPTWL